MSWKVNYLNEVEELIKKGAVQAYHENLMMCYEHTEFKSRMVEYLVVVNIAKLLMEWSLPKDLQVHLEYSLADFYNGAFPSIKWNGESIFDSGLLNRGDHNPKGNKSGRIDIALTAQPLNKGYYRTNYMSLVGIEVKSISNQKRTIIKDIHRLSSAMVLQDSIGDNNIEACYSIFYRRLDNVKKINSDEELKAKKEKELEGWKSTLEEIKKAYPLLTFIIDPIEIEESNIEDVIDCYPPEHFDYTDVAEKTGLIMCCLIKMVFNAR